MLGNTFGRLFQVTTCGESYGWRADAKDGRLRRGAADDRQRRAAGDQLDVAKIQYELDKRRPGQSKLDSPRKETDRVEVVSGLAGGRHHRRAGGPADPQRRHAGRPHRPVPRRSRTSSVPATRR